MASYYANQAGASGQPSHAGQDNPRFKQNASYSHGRMDEIKPRLSNGTSEPHNDLASLEADLRVLTKLRRDIVSGRHPFYKAPKNAPSLPRRPNPTSRYSSSNAQGKNISVNAERMSPEATGPYANSRTRAPSIPATATSASPSAGQTPLLIKSDRSNGLNVSSSKRPNEEPRYDRHSESKRPRKDLDSAAPASGPGAAPAAFSHTRHPSLPEKPREDLRSAASSAQTTELQPELSVRAPSPMRTTTRSTDSASRREYPDSGIPGGPRRTEASTYRPHEQQSHSAADARNRSEPVSRDAKAEVRKPDKFEKQRLPPASKPSSSSASSSAPVSTKADDRSFDKPQVRSGAATPRDIERERDYDRSYGRELAIRSEFIDADGRAPPIDRKLVSERGRDSGDKRRSPPPYDATLPSEPRRYRENGPVAPRNDLGRSGYRDDYGHTRSRPISPAPASFPSARPASRGVSPAPALLRYDGASRTSRDPRPLTTAAPGRASSPDFTRRVETGDSRLSPFSARDQSPPRRPGISHASEQEVPFSAPIMYGRPLRRDDAPAKPVPARDNYSFVPDGRDRETKTTNGRDRSPPRRSASGQNLQDRIFYGTELGVQDSPPSARYARDARAVSDARSVANARAALQDRQTGSDRPIESHSRPAAPPAAGESLFNRLSRSTDNVPIPPIKTGREEHAPPREARSVIDDRDARDARDRAWPVQESASREEHKTKGNYVGPATSAGQSTGADLRNRISASAAATGNSDSPNRQQMAQPVRDSNRDHISYDAGSERPRQYPPPAFGKYEQADRLDQGTHPPQTVDSRGRAHAYSPDLPGGQYFPPRGASENRATGTSARDTRPAYADTHRPYSPPAESDPSLYPPRLASFPPPPPAAFSPTSYPSAPTYPPAVGSRYADSPSLQNSKAVYDDRPFPYNSRDRHDDRAGRTSYPSANPQYNAYSPDNMYGEEYYRLPYEPARHSAAQSGYPSDSGYSYSAKDPYAQAPPPFVRPQRSSQYYDYDAKSIVPAPYDERDRPMYSAPPTRASTYAPARSESGGYAREDDYRRSAGDYRRNDDRRR